MSLQHTFKTKLLLLAFVLISIISNAQTAGSFKLLSSAFEAGKPIPAKYTCDSADISPPLSWSGSPAKTKSFAIIMDDPDAPMGTWTHWVIYNIPAAVINLEEKMSAAQINATEGLNSWNEKGYNGPCPPGGTHQYHFKLFALDDILSAKNPMTKEELLEAMKGHILGEAILTGLFRIE